MTPQAGAQQGTGDAAGAAAAAGAGGAAGAAAPQAGAAAPVLQGLGAPAIELPGSGAPGAQQGTQGAGAGGPADQGKPKEATPETKIKLHDRVASEGLQQVFEKATKEWGLKGEHAQQLADAFGGRIEELGQTFIEGERQRVVEMDQALRLDPELGGANLVTTQANMRRYFTEHDKDGALVKLLENNPTLYYDKAVVRLLSFAGAQSRDDTVAGTHGNRPGQEEVPFDQLPVEERYRRSFPNSPIPGR